MDEDLTKYKSGVDLIVAPDKETAEAYLDVNGNHAHIVWPGCNKVRGRILRGGDKLIVLPGTYSPQVFSEMMALAYGQLSPTKDRDAIEVVVG